MVAELLKINEKETVMDNVNNQNEIVKMLKDKKYAVDESGKVLIEDPALAELIKGGLGGSSGETPDALWNGACSNSSCFI